MREQDIDLYTNNTGYNPQRLEDCFKQFYLVKEKTILVIEEDGKERLLHRIFLGSELDFIKSHPFIFAYKYNRGFYI